ncbi:hypothetical protein PTTG_05324 [Puccinia triticina 1-1 BBBD Race 1]|uniref:Uncharacterized protein n=1 Tax=Puccinia triticina (isolate 1-1 / race 1 (BBBD)) TaxID=630390 RepID=A0A180H1A4_PUCT1|nr:hypothetical protein PTTG_05324 [Puccinia triticina 1-1 BBBD Race 1]
MVQRKPTDSNRTTRSEAKPATNSDANSDSDSDSDLHSNGSESDSSSSDTQPDTNHSDQEQTFILHRHLDYSYHHPANQRPSNQPAGFDLFTAKTWTLDDDQLSQFNQPNDTDLVQIHCPVPIKEEPAKKLTLADVLPPHHPSSSSSVYNNLPTKTRLPKLSPSPFSGSSVSSLYYSAYSSFAPCYDSTSSTQTLDQARILFQSKQKIDFWSRRAHRYHDVLIEPPAADNLNSSTSSSNLKKKKSSAPASRGRKRQKTSSSSVAPSTPSSSPAKEPPPPPASPGKIRQEISATLLETSKLISNLQERQLDRLRLCQEVHLDPCLSTPPLYPRQNPAPNQLVNPEPSREEIAEAHQLVQRLSSVIARRPRPAGSHDDDDEDGNDESTMEAAQSVIPSAEAIRKSYKVLAIGAGADSACARAVYTGLLPPTNPVGIHESMLVSKPSPQLISVLEHTQRSNPSAASTPRIGAGLPIGSSPQYLPHSVPGPVSSRRDPSLANARIGPSGPPAMISTPDLLVNRPPLNGQAVHNNISKLQLLQQQQQQQQQQHHHHGLPANHHHHPALHQQEQAGPLRPHLGAPPGQTDQQRHLHQLQVQKLLATSYASPVQHLMSSPAVAPPAVPTIATPSLKPVAASLAYHRDINPPTLPHNNLNIPHPNHRALASSSSSSASSASHSALR